MDRSKRRGRSRWLSAQKAPHSYWEEREQRVREQGWHTYRAYTSSPQWLARRRRWYRENPGAVCYVCWKRPKRLILHHRTYKRLGDELNQDLVPLCSKHHSATHNLHLLERVPLREAHEMVRAAYMDLPEAEREREVAQVMAPPKPRQVDPPKRRRRKRRQPRERVPRDVLAVAAALDREWEDAARAD